MKLNSKDRARLAGFMQVMPAGLEWSAERIFGWFTTHQHDLKAIPEKMMAKDKHQEVQDYLKATFVDGRKAKAPAKPKEPKAPKQQKAAKTKKPAANAKK